MATILVTGGSGTLGAHVVTRLRGKGHDVREQRGRPRRTLRLPLPGATARAFRQGLNTCPDRKVGTVTWAQYLAAGPSGPA